MSIFIGSIPNTQEDDLKLAKEILKGDIDISSSINQLKDFFPQDTYFLNKGRDSLNLILKSIDLKDNDEIILQSFTCIAVVAPVIWNKAKPIYIDIKRNSLNMDIEDLKKKISSKTRAIIIQHSFGNIADVKSVKNLVDQINKDRGNKIYLIEDCAHLFQLKDDKSPLGLFSDAYFFSFSQDKSISCTQGSALVINNKDLKDTVKSLYRNISDLNKRDSIYTAKYIIYWSHIRSLYFKTIPLFKKISIGKVLLVIYRFFGCIKKQASLNTLDEEQMHKMSDIQASLLLNQIRKVRELNKHRERVVDMYNKGLKEEFRFNTINKGLLRYPIFIQNRAEIKELLRKKNIIVGIWYSTPIFPLRFNGELESVGYSRGLCPVALACSSTVLNLPTNIEVTSSDIESIVEIINKFGVVSKF